MKMEYVRIKCFIRVIYKKNEKLNFDLKITINHDEIYKKETK